MHWFHLKIYFKVNYIPCVTGLVKTVKTVLEKSTVLIMLKKKQKTSCSISWPFKCRNALRSCWIEPINIGIRAISLDVTLQIQFSHSKSCLTFEISIIYFQMTSKYKCNQLPTIVQSYYKNKELLVLEGKSWIFILFVPV